MSHLLWQPDALVGRRALTLAANSSGLWVAVDDEETRTLYRSADEGRSWRLASTGLPAAAQVTGLHPVPGGLMLGTRACGLFRTTNHGGTWHPIKNRLLQREHLVALATWNDVLFAATRTAGIFRSTDGGHSWQDSNRGLPFQGEGLDVLALAWTQAGIMVSHALGIHRADSTAWAPAYTGLPPSVRFPWLDTSGDLVVTGGATGLYLSTDAGASWTHVLPPSSSPLRVTSLAVSADVIYAGTLHPTDGSGISASCDGGFSWHALQAYLPSSLTPICLAAFPGGLLAHTEELGVWIHSHGELRPLSTHRPAAWTTRLPMVLQPNEPNPFSHTTTISYVLHRAAAVRLDVSDVSDGVIARLVDTSQAAGEYCVAFDGEHLEGGFYTYRLTVGSLSQTRQMLLLR